MTVTALLLFILAVVALVGVLAFRNPAPPRPLSERERAGRHRHPDDQDTTRLDDYRPGHRIR